ncbi:tetratricopeptide repeat protein [Desmonostoc muscorum LEGE 12446]|uniref:CHAT domain-containing protein n=1 Tax=Desmonostoc muscorum TaxID=1179 RepID=UPI001F3E58CF|nr:tetratricopeptide repeat protein [Desmonostoc muscorum]MCF2151308.1 tetratricopeptide repeat protein [Desmonostoc muscorum LEGE 12446]
MHYRLKSLSIATLVLCLSLPVGVAESQIRGNVQTTLTAQAQTTQEHRDEALRLNELGLQQLNKGQFREALKTFEQALAIFQQIGDTAGEGTILNNIGVLYRNLGQYAKALEFYQQALAIRKQTSNTEGEGNTLNNIGGVYFSLGQYAKALEFYQQALAIAKQIGNTAGEGATLNNIGVVYSNLGQYAKALEFYQQALAIRKQIGDTAGEGNTLNNIGLIYDNLGQYAKALEFYQQALAIPKQIGDTAGEGNTLNNIGGVYFSLGQYAKALEFYQQALAIGKQIGDTAGEGITLNNIGAVYRNLGQYAKALEFYQQALAIAKQIGNTAGEGATLNNIGVVYSNLGQYAKALEFYQQALAIRKQIGDTAGEGRTLNNIGLIYDNLGQYADAEKTLFAAIEVLESLRTKTLSDDQKISIFEIQPQTYRFLERVLIAQNKTNTALEISERGRARAFIELLASKISGNIDNQQAIKPPNIEQIQQTAKAQNATLVEYSVNESNLYIWVIKPTGKIAFKQVDLKSLKTPLAQLVNKSRLSIGAGGRGIKVEPKNESTKKQNLQKLYEVLIEPIASLLPTNPDEHVIFIPHDSLFLVPFVALQDKDGKYLIEKHTILTAPAIQVLDLTHQQRQKVTGKDVLVMGNPTMPKVGIPPVQLDPLLGAEKEALTIANLFKIKAITGKDATKAAFKQKLSSARIIHLATHGLLDDADKSIPSAIALAPTSNDDGLLTPAEIVDLKINAELVVLSACDTGRGAITGDGVVGLSRSLITAGASSVIVSLWKVPDSSTSELMTEFYQQWEKNPDKAAALRNAMLITMKKHPQPVNWAAFTLIGES